MFLWISLLAYILHVLKNSWLWCKAYIFCLYENTISCYYYAADDKRKDFCCYIKSSSRSCFLFVLNTYLLWTKHIFVTTVLPRCHVSVSIIKCICNISTMLQQLWSILYLLACPAHGSAKKNLHETIKLIYKCCIYFDTTSWLYSLQRNDSNCYSSWYQTTNHLKYLKKM